MECTIISNNNLAVISSLSPSSVYVWDCFWTLIDVSPTLSLYLLSLADRLTSELWDYYVQTGELIIHRTFQVRCYSLITSWRLPWRWLTRVEQFRFASFLAVCTIVSLFFCLWMEELVFVKAWDHLGLDSFSSTEPYLFWSLLQCHHETWKEETVHGVGCSPLLCPGILVPGSIGSVDLEPRSSSGLLV